MLQAIFEGQRKPSINDGEGGATTASEAIPTLCSKGPATGEGGSSVGKCLRGAREVESSIGTLSLGCVPLSRGSGFGVLVEYHALELEFQSEVVALKRSHREEIRRV